MKRLGDNSFIKVIHSFINGGFSSKSSPITVKVQCNKSQLWSYVVSCRSWSTGLEWLYVTDVMKICVWSAQFHNWVGCKHWPKKIWPQKIGHYQQSWRIHSKNGSTLILRGLFLLQHPYALVFLTTSASLAQSWWGTHSSPLSLIHNLF